LATILAVTVTSSLLDRLDGLIRKYELHDSGLAAPVSIDRLLEDYDASYKALPYYVDAVTFRWRRQGEELVAFTYNERLLELSQSARKRHAQAHEFAHEFCKHRGNVFIMWGAGTECVGLEGYINNKQEHQCECIAAYLLVPMRAFRELRDCEAEQVARLLDVPARLVELRWAIWLKFGR
jgi:hypothetical protein